MTPTKLFAGSAIVIAAALHFAQPVQAGTCSPVTAIGRSPDLGTATAKAQTRLKEKAARIGGKVTQASTNCTKGAAAYSCKIKAVVCP